MKVEQYWNMKTGFNLCAPIVFHAIFGCPDNIAFIYLSELTNHLDKNWYLVSTGIVFMVTQYISRFYNSK
jgi:hypothetical protein